MNDNSPLNQISNLAQEPSTEESQIFAPLSAGTKKTKTTPLGPSQTEDILAQMQQIIDKRNSPMQTFLSGLKGASAWGSGGENGPGAQLALLDRERMLEEKDTLGMQEKMAQLRNNAEQLKGMQTYFSSPTSGGTPGASGGTPGGQTNLDTMLNSLPPEQRAIGEYYAKTNPNALMEMVTQNSLKTPDDIKKFNLIQKLPPAERDFQMRALFPKGYEPQTEIDPRTGETIKFTPPGAMRAPQQGPSTPSQYSSNNFAAQNNIPVSPNGGYRTNAQQRSEFAKNPSLAAVPGTSPHEAGRAYDVPVAQQTPDVIAKLKRAGYEQNLKNEPWHWELPKNVSLPTAKAEIATNREAPVTLEDLARKQKTFEKSTESFYNEDLKQINADAVAAKEKLKLVDPALDNIKGDKFGPGTALNQSLMKYYQLAGGKLEGKELEKYISNLTIENARKFISAASARQAMGAQFTATEAEGWLNAFAGIDSPKEYLKNFYQIQKAGALIDLEVKDLMLRNRGNEQDALIKWQDSGRKDKIMQENVDAFKNGKVNAANKPIAQPKQKTVTKTGMVTDKNNPNYGKQAIRYSDGTTEFK